MPVPGFQDMFLPFLQFLSDGETKHTREIQQHIADHFKLSEEDRNDMIPSGQSSRLANRIGWGRTHLNKAGLIQQVTRGNYCITEDGKQIVASPPALLNLKFLDTIPRHKEWFHKTKPKQVDPTKIDIVEVAGPDERIEEAFTELKESLADELLDTMAVMDPFRFEQLVVDLLFAMGYGGSRQEAARVTQKSNDGGIDGIINEDRLGLDVIYIQAKRYQASSSIGRKEIQSFVGALAGQQAHKGVFITTSNFTKTATEYANTVIQKVILIDGPRLASLMIEHNIGVSTQRVISLKRIDSDYFEL
ncbi:MAG: restriction endonuclease [Akkermansiaceae bacterium]